MTLAELGELLGLVVGTLQSIFDERTRHEIVQEISEAALGTDRIFHNGIRDALFNSKKIDDDNVWKSSDCLIIGVHYSNRFFEDNTDIIKHRTSQNRTTKVFHIDDQSNAADYLRLSNSGISDINEKTNDLRNILENEFDNNWLVKIYKHDRVLRYSFIKTDQSIWIKFFTNSAGYAIVPTMKVEVGTPFYQFFSKDIDQLLESSCEFQ